MIVIEMRVTTNKFEYTILVYLGAHQWRISARQWNPGGDHELYGGIFLWTG